MNRICKGLTLILSLLFLFTLCLTPPVFATEGTQAWIPNNSDTPSEESQPQNSDSPPTTSIADTASSQAELLDWLDKNKEIGGTVTLSQDITLDDAQVLHSSGQPITIDVGNYGISIIGEVELLCSDLTIIGTGNEHGLVQVLQGGTLHLNYMSINAAEGSVALSQAEGAGLLVSSECNIKGEIAYAKTPFIWYWNETPLVLVNAEQIAQLPETVSAQVNAQGKMERQNVPVQWALEAQEEAQKLRRRFISVGSVENYAMAVVATCTVVYDDFPLTFTKITAQNQPWYYRIAGGFTKPKVTLPITVIEEYSFDGLNWIKYHERSIENPYDGFSFELEKDKDEKHYWDTTASQYLYIRLHWYDGVDYYYSNILRFAAADFTLAEDIGGNRGGGTAITVPPKDDGLDGEESDLPNTELPSKESSNLDCDTEENATPQPTRTPALTITPTPDTTSVQIPPKPEQSDKVIFTQPPIVDSAPKPQTSNHLHVVVGCVAVTGIIAIAGLYLYPQSLKGLLKLLKNWIERK